MRQRLIGAAVLVALAVLFLPLLFENRSLQMIPNGQPLKKAPIWTEVVPEEASPNPEITPVKPPEAMYSLDEAAAASANHGSFFNVLNESGEPEGWVIQVASYSTEEAAEAFRQRLLADGYKAFMRSAVAGDKTVYRIYVGPYLNRTTVNNEQKAINARYKLETLLIRFKP